MRRRSTMMMTRCFGSSSSASLTPTLFAAAAATAVKSKARRKRLTKKGRDDGQLLTTIVVASPCENAGSAKSASRTEREDEVEAGAKCSPVSPSSPPLSSSSSSSDPLASISFPPLSSSSSSSDPLASISPLTFSRVARHPSNNALVQSMLAKALAATMEGNCSNAQHQQQHHHHPHTPHHHLHAATIEGLDEDAMSLFGHHSSSSSSPPHHGYRQRIGGPAEAMKIIDCAREVALLDEACVVPLSPTPTLASTTDITASSPSSSLLLPSANSSSSASHPMIAIPSLPTKNEHAKACARALYSAHPYLLNSAWRAARGRVNNGNNAKGASVLKNNGESKHAEGREEQMSNTSPFSDDRSSSPPTNPFAYPPSAAFMSIREISLIFAAMKRALKDQLEATYDLEGDLGIVLDASGRIRGTAAPRDSSSLTPSAPLNTTETRKKKKKTKKHASSSSSSSPSWGHRIHMSLIGDVKRETALFYRGAIHVLLTHSSITAARRGAAVGGGLRHTKGSSDGKGAAIHNSDGFFMRLKEAVSSRQRRGGGGGTWKRAVDVAVIGDDAEEALEVFNGLVRKVTRTLEMSGIAKKVSVFPNRLPSTHSVRYRTFPHIQTVPKNPFLRQEHREALLVAQPTITADQVKCLGAYRYPQRTVCIHIVPIELYIPRLALLSYDEDTLTAMYTAAAGKGLRLSYEGGLEEERENDADDKGSDDDQHDAAHRPSSRFRTIFIKSESELFARIGMDRN